MAGLIQQKLYDSPKSPAKTQEPYQLQPANPQGLPQGDYNSPQTPAGTPVPQPLQPAQQPPQQATGTGVLSQLSDIIKAAQAATPQVRQPATVTAQTPGATLGSVDPSQTTAGLIERMLKQDSDYITRAKAIAMERMGERGLQSSSLAQGAGVGAAIDAAGNVASQDANIYAQQRLANQEAANAMARANADRTLNAGTFNAGAQNQQGLAEYDAANQLSRAIIGSQLDKDSMAFKSGLSLQEMDYGSKLDLMKMAAANGYDIEKLARQQGYTLEQMSAALGFDMTKMAKGQELDLQKLAVANGYDVQKMAIDFDNRLKLQDAASRLDTAVRKDLMAFESQLGNSATGRSALANLAGKYADLFDATRRDPNLPAEDKARALDDLRADFKANAARVADLYSLDATSYLNAIGISAPAPAPVPAPAPAAPAPAASSSSGFVTGGDAGP